MDIQWENLGINKPDIEKKLLCYSSFTDTYYLEFTDSAFWMRVSKYQYTHYIFLTKPKI